MELLLGALATAARTGRVRGGARDTATLGPPAHNVVFNVLSVVFLLGWHVFHMKSTVGVAIDSTPNVVMAAYIVSSRRVRETLRR
jgi:hypothetical protein